MLWSCSTVRGLYSFWPYSKCNQPYFMNAFRPCAVVHKTNQLSFLAVLIWHSDWKPVLLWVLCTSKVHTNYFLVSVCLISIHGCTGPGNPYHPIFTDVSYFYEIYLGVRQIQFITLQNLVVCIFLSQPDVVSHHAINQCVQQGTLSCVGHHEIFAAFWNPCGSKGLTVFALWFPE